MDIIPRMAWQARPPRKADQVYTVPWSVRTEFFVHHTAGPVSQTLKAIQAYHQDGNGWNDIGYNFLVDEHGAIYEGRGWLVVGAHCPDHNRIGVSVAFIGNNNPTAAAETSIAWLYGEANRRAGRTLKRLCHGDKYPTMCPGPKLRAWVKAGMPLKEVELPVGADGVPEFSRMLVYRTGDQMMHGPDVLAWQERVEKRGWELDTDGWYGRDSAGVCEAFQAAIGGTPSGRVDKTTWANTWLWKPPTPGLLDTTN